jgi:hypothetical protein
MLERFWKFNWLERKQKWLWDGFRGSGETRLFCLFKFSWKNLNPSSFVSLKINIFKSQEKSLAFFKCRRFQLKLAKKKPKEIWNWRMSEFFPIKLESRVALKCFLLPPESQSQNNCLKAFPSSQISVRMTFVWINSSFDGFGKYG